MKKRLLSLVLAIVMVMGIAVPASAASAGSSYWKNSNVYNVDGVDYMNIGAEPAGYKTQVDLFRKLLATQPSGSRYQDQDASLAEMWLRLAAWIHWFHSPSTAPDGPLVEAAYAKDGPMNLQTPDEYERYWAGKDNEDGYDVFTSGIQFVNSLEQADREMASFASQTKNDRCDKQYHMSFPTCGLGVDSNKYQESQPVAYLMIRASKSTGKYNQQRGHGAGVGVIFYDFNLTPILPDQEQSGSQFSAQKDGNATVTSLVRPTDVINDTAGTATGGVAYSTDYSLSTSTSFSSSKSFSLGTAMTVGTEWGTKVGPFTGNFSFDMTTSMESAVSSTWSEGNETIEEKGQDITLSVALEPYTRATLEITERSQPTKVSFKSPMYLTYKVIITDYSLDIDNSGKTFTGVLASFPNHQKPIVDEPQDAVGSLTYRYHDAGEMENQINWGFVRLFSQATTASGRNCSTDFVVDALQYEVPSAFHVEEMKMVQTTITEKAGSMTALYPLAKIRPVNNKDIKLNKGGSILLNDIHVEGFNNMNGPFYGFSESQGEWIICDKNGNPTTSDIASISRDPSTGKQKLSAGKRDGTTYIKFLIDEDYYKNEHIYTGAAFSNSTIDSTPIPVTTIQKNFHDVHTYDYFYEPVYWAVNNGITTGLNSTTFGPKEECTREQVATFLWRYAGKPAPQGKNPFRDVYAGHYAYDPIVWAAEQGIAKGVTPTTFGPKDEVTRAQFVTMLWRLAGQPQPKSMKSPFKDVNANSWYGKAVLWAVENGITTGAGNGKFNPNGLCERAQVVTFLYRYNNIK